ncbi:MAG: hypothetical protein U0166_00480 [Acidobacteriota bacterium]
MRRLLLAGLSALVGLVAVWIVAGGALARSRERAVISRWSAAGLPIDDFAARYPPHGPSEAALRIEKAASRLGIALAPASDRSRPREEDVRRLDDLDVSSTVARRFEKDDHGPLPGPLAGFLAEHASVLEEVRAAALAGDVAWEQDVERLYAAPEPKSRGHRSLVALLVLAALDRASAGDGPGALGFIDAGHRINDAMRARPDLLSLALATTAERMLLGALRRIPAPPIEWIDRLAADDRQSLLVALEREGWMLTSVGTMGDASSLSVLRDGERDAVATTLLRLRAPLERPYLRLAGASSSDLVRQVAEGIARAQLCDFDAVRLHALVPADLPAWNVLGDVAVPGIGRLVPLVGRAALDRELTALALRVAATRSASGAWPPPGLAVEPGACPEMALDAGETRTCFRSAVCPSLVWVLRERPAATTIVSWGKTMPASSSGPGFVPPALLGTEGLPLELVLPSLIPSTAD